MTLPTNLPTGTADRDPGHTAGHRATNSRVNEVAAAVNATNALFDEFTAAATAQDIFPDTDRSSTIVLGDSLCANFITTTQYGVGWFNFLCTLSGQRMLLADFAGITNNTVQDAIARLQTDVIAKDPDRCMVLLGTNNTNQASPTLAATMTAYEDDLILPLLRARIEPIVCTVPPRNTVRTTDLPTYRRQATWNAFVRRIASKYRLPLLDTYRAVADPTTGDYRAGYSDDGLHWNAVGGRAVADFALTALDRVMPPQTRVPLELDRYAPLNLATSPLFLDGLGSGSGGLYPSGWNGPTTGVTVSIVDPVGGDGLEAGKWLKVAKTAGTSANVNNIRTLAALSTAGNPVAGGDRIAFGFRFQIANVTGGAYVHANLRFRDSSGVDLKSLFPLSTFSQAIPSGAVWIEALAPATGLDSIRFDLSLSSAGTIDVSIGQVTLLNLTALGIPGFVELM